MGARAGDPHRIQDELEGAEDYQAPPREHEQEDGDKQPSDGHDDPVDITLLEAQQQRPGLQTSETVDSGQDPSPPVTVSGKDELGDPNNPRAVPPGERM